MSSNWIKFILPGKLLQDDASELFLLGRYLIALFTSAS